MESKNIARPELRARRLYLGFSQERLGEAVGVSSVSISNWERGTLTPAPRYRAPLAEALQVDLGQIRRMIDPSAPLNIEPHAVDHWLDLYESLIAAAGAVRHVETIAVPALLQTRDYARVLEEQLPFFVNDEEADYQVELRMARQAVLEREPVPLDYQVLIHEAILTAVVGSPEIMAEQLDQVDRLFHQPNIDIRVLPHDGQALFARGGFELVAKQGKTRPFLAITFDIDNARYEQRRRILAEFQTMYDYLLDGVALSPADSRARIRHHLRSLQ